MYLKIINALKQRVDLLLMVPKQQQSKETEQTEQKSNNKKLSHPI